jgi:hypothetical protein
VPAPAAADAVALTMAEPLREPGWYRLTEAGWVPVDDTMAKAEIAAGGGWDLVHVKTAAMAETPLF